MPNVVRSEGALWRNVGSFFLSAGSVGYSPGVTYPVALFYPDGVGGDTSQVLTIMMVCISVITTESIFQY